MGGGEGGGAPDLSGPATHRELGSSHYYLHAGLPTQFCSAGVFTGAFGITVFASFITGDKKDKLFGYSGEQIVCLVQKEKCQWRKIRHTC